MARRGRRAAAATTASSERDCCFKAALHAQQEPAGSALHAQEELGPGQKSQKSIRLTNCSASRSFQIDPFVKQAIKLFGNQFIIQFLNDSINYYLAIILF